MRYSRLWSGSDERKVTSNNKNVRIALTLAITFLCVGGDGVWGRTSYGPRASEVIAVAEERPLQAEEPQEQMQVIYKIEDVDPQEQQKLQQQQLLKTEEEKIQFPKNEVLNDSTSENVTAGQFEVEPISNGTENINSVKKDEEADENEDEEVVPQARISYAGSQVWKAKIDNRQSIKVLARLRDEHDISMWGGNATSIDVLVKSTSIDKVRKVLMENGINTEVMIEDLQMAIDAENPSEIELDDRRGHRLTWQAYHRLNDIQGYLDYLAETYPDLCSVKTIGSSVQGRPIKVLKISNGNPGNKGVWVDGGIHAREWISPATVTYIINHLVSNYESESKSVQSIDWYFAPVLNPDGYEYSHSVDRLWRKNRQSSGVCTGTDLNRNFGYRWGGKGSSKNPCTETYGGRGPFSEPETAAIRNFIQGNPNANWKGYISFHSYGQYVLYPWGYDRVVPPDYKDLERVAQKIANAIRSTGGPSYTVGPAANTLYPASGGSDDWAKGSAGFKYSYTIELRDNGRYGFVLPASHIRPTATEGLAVIRVIAEAAAAA